MDCGDWELAGTAQERARRKNRKKNDAFRERLRQQARRRETIRFKLASLAAAVAWGAAVAQFFR